jgi:hypothetical protein
LKLSRLSFVCALCVAAAGCGGGGGDDAAPPASPPRLDPSNYLDALYIGLMGGDRLQDAELLADAGYKIVRDNADAPGTYPCVGAGTLTYSVSGNTRTYSASDCVLTSDITVVSGSWRIADLRTTDLAPGTTFLSGGTVTYADVLLRLAVGLGICSAVSHPPNETFNGTLTVARSAPPNTTPVGTWTGSLNVARNGRTDEYTNLSVETRDFEFNTVNQTSELGSASYRVNTLRFARSALDVSINYRVFAASVASVDDGSRAEISIPTPMADQLRYRVFPSANATTASADESLSNTSSRVSDAVVRALQ